MRIKRIASAMLVAVITLFVLTGICVVLLNASERQERQALQRQAEFKQLGIDLADASDYLTNKIRHYAQFGETVHLDNFWREVRETRTRDRVIERLKELGAPGSELALVELAKQNSDALIAIEEQAMAAVARGDFQTARELVFGQEYERHKLDIMNPLAQFQQTMNSRAQGEAQAASSRTVLMLVLSNFFILLSAVAVTLMIYRVLIRRTVQPLTRLTDCMRTLADGDTAVEIPQSSFQDEVADMTAAIAVFRDNAVARNRLEAEQTERAAELDHKNHELQNALGKMEDELELAKQMQQSILPSHHPQWRDFDLFANMIAAREVGGDFYDVIEIDSDRVGIVIADVSGKGVPAALFMAVSCTIIKSAAVRGLDPGAVLERANEQLLRENDAAMFVTLFYGIIDTRNNLLSYANAGHNPPYLIRGDNSVATLSGTGGIALGISEEASYTETTIDLASGDTIFCYTDGITEAMNADGREFSDESLRNLLSETGGPSAEALGRRVIERVSDFAGSAKQSDDITCVVLHYRPLEETEDKSKQGLLHTSFINDFSELDRMSELVKLFCSRHSLSKSLAHDLRLVIDELMSNTINHGFDDDAEHSIELVLQLEGNTLTVEMQDEGQAFDPRDLPEPDLESALEERPVGGLGLHLVKTIMDTIEYHRYKGRNILTLKKVLQAT